ncbi:ABC transporter permease [Streptomyces sp. NPDC001297]|uniref:ABC transporter permease n=1 Tax=Streptomyces sp. NPDC001297 TaxID=3364559 RepID=UPI0036CAE8ED
MAVALPLVISVAVLAYAWPAARVAPRDLPVGIVGTSAASQGVVEGLAHGRPGAFDFRLYPDVASARTAVRERDVYGAFAVTPGSLTVLESTAASPTVAQLLDATGTQLAARASAAAARAAAAREGAARDSSAHAKPAHGKAPHAESARAGSASGGSGKDGKDGKDGAGKPAPVEVRTVDVVRISADDPRGAVFSSSLLPMTICSIVIALVVALALRLRPVVRALTLVVVSAAAALGVYLVAQGWLGALPHDPLATWAALALTILAISATTAGMITLVGSGGLGPCAALMVFVGNPFSGSTSAPELLPTAVREIGQWLPPGAGASLVRGTAYFDGNGSAGHVAVLALWSVLGLAAVLFGHHTYPLARRPVPGEGATAGPDGPAAGTAAPRQPSSAEDGSSAPVRAGTHAHARHAAGA